MRSALAALLVLFSLTACGERESPAPKASVAPASEARPDAQPAPAETIPPLPEAAPEGSASPQAEAGRLKYSTHCLSCHGATGQGMGPFPKLAGLTSAAIAAKLVDYRAGKTLGPQTSVMTPFAKAMSDAEIEAVAEYIAAF